MALLVVLIAAASGCTSPQPATNTTLGISLDLNGGTMTAVGDYARGDITGDTFLLNRSFTVTKLLVDGKKIDPGKIVEQVSLNPTGMGLGTISIYTLPHITRSVHVEYEGSLDGTTGTAAYAKETISPNFSFLRWETFCMPVFADLDTLDTVLDNPLSITITVDVPTGNTVEFTSETTSTQDTADRTYFSTRTDLPNAQIAVAIGHYQVISLSTGDYFFLNSTPTDLTLSTIEDVMTQAYSFMNTHFGTRTFAQPFRAVEIPQGLGSFEVPQSHMAYIDSSAYYSKASMSQLVHEFIHSGWNAQVVDPEVLKARFFDEAFTTYFQYRAMVDQLGDEAMAPMLASLRDLRGYSPIPISEFGSQGAGDLSYTIGALCLYELSQLIGVDSFDRITTQFLADFTNAPADFGSFCAEYERGSGDPRVTQFFDDWIYSDEYASSL